MHHLQPGIEVLLRPFVNVERDPGLQERAVNLFDEEAGFGALNGVRGKEFRLRIYVGEKLEEDA